MGFFTDFKINTKKIDHDSLRIDLNKGRIGGNLSGFKFTEKDTKQSVIYIPSLELSGYGDNFDKANEMLRFSMQEFFDFLFNLPSNKIQIELSKLGWKKGIFNKEFSRAYIDVTGEIKNLNAEDNKVERITLTAA